MTLRFDTAPISGVTRLPTGGIRVGANLSRPGVQEYLNPDGSIRREYRPPAEVFAPEALAALRGAPVTDLHPPGDGSVRADNWRALAIGHVGDDVRPSEDQRFVESSIVIQDARSVKRIDSGDRPEVSVGYTVEIDPTPGVTPEGEAYDVIQRRIRPNHVALVPRGRAGAEVRLRLDSAGDMCPPREEQAPMKILIDGREYEHGSPEHKAAEAAAKQRADARDAEIAAARKARVIAEARGARIKVRADAADARTVMTEAIAAIAPGVDLNGASDDFLAGAFAVVVTMAVAKMAEEKPAAPAPASQPAAGAEAVRGDAARPEAPVKRADSAPRGKTADELLDENLTRSGAFKG